MARRNISGSAAANYATLARNQAAIGGNRADLDVDFTNEKMKASGRDSAFRNLYNAANSKHSARNNIAQLLADLQTKYNPLNTMSQMQGVAQPLAEIASLRKRR